MYNHQLDTFVRAVELGSFGKAAESLYISTTAVAQQINLLEGLCGFKLFTRSPRGVKLTAAGKSLYEDSKSLIHFSENALQKARQLAERSETTLRIGTSLLYKCRMLPDLWTAAGDALPGLKIEILPIREYENRDVFFAKLGVEFDIFEGIYASAWDGACQFLELRRTPVCCAVSKSHRLAGAERLSFRDLSGETLVMPVQGASRELDALRERLASELPSVQIIDSAYYGLDTFAMCELNGYVLITQDIYRDIHPDLLTISLNAPVTMPYGLIYPNDPTAVTSRFLTAVKRRSAAHDSAPIIPPR